jgi:hypothetical protein
VLPLAPPSVPLVPADMLPPLPGMPAAPPNAPFVPLLPMAPPLLTAPEPPELSSESPGLEPSWAVAHAANQSEPRHSTLKREIFMAPILEPVS